MSSRLRKSLFTAATILFYAAVILFLRVPGFGYYLAAVLVAGLITGIRILVVVNTGSLSRDIGWGLFWGTLISIITITILLFWALGHMI
jgi:hypothetical protein